MPRVAPKPCLGVKFAERTGAPAPGQRCCARGRPPPPRSQYLRALLPASGHSSANKSLWPEGAPGDVEASTSAAVA